MSIESAPVGRILCAGGSDTGEFFIDIRQKNELEGSKIQEKSCSMYCCTSGYSCCKGRKRRTERDEKRPMVLFSTFVSRGISRSAILELEERRMKAAVQLKWINGLTYTHTTDTRAQTHLPFLDQSGWPVYSYPMCEAMDG